MAGLQKDVSNIHNLRNLIKRDPLGYEDEFHQQYSHFQATLEIFKLKERNLHTTTTTTTSSSSAAAAAAATTATAADSRTVAVASHKGKSRDAKQFGELIEFLAHVVPCYPKHDNNFPDELMTMISNHYDTLEPYLRKSIVQALILLSGRELVARIRLLPVLFRLFACRDKALRQLVFTHIVSDIRRVNKKTQNLKLNNSLQNFLFNLLRDDSLIMVKKSLEVMMRLWQKNVWRNEKVANAIVTTCFHTDTGIKRASLLFFVGQYDESDETDDFDTKDAMRSINESNQSMLAAKRNKKRQREVDRVKRKMKRAQRADEEADSDDDEAMVRAKSYSSVGANLRVPAIQMVYDAQSFAERMFTQLRKSNQAFDVRLLMMNVISRFVGAHKLILFNFYPFLQKYMTPQQDRVTLVLTYLAQSSHDLVPSDILQPCLRCIADGFVTDRASPEYMAVGLNAIREVCARCPLAISSELLQDLVLYKGNKTKGVMMAARSLIALYREVAPSMLHRRDRGRDASVKISAGGAHMPEYGESFVATDVDGADLLLLDEKQHQANGVGVGVGDDDDDDDDDVDGDDGDKAKAFPMASSRVFTQEDFDRIKQLQDERDGNKRKRGGLHREDGSSLFNTSASAAEAGVVDEEDIIGYVKRARADKAERMASVEEGRTDRVDFRRGTKEKGGGTTNKEKKRHQPFQLQKQARKIKGKVTLKASEKLRRKGKHIKKMKQQSLSNKKAFRRV